MVGSGQGSRPENGRNDASAFASALLIGLSVGFARLRFRTNNPLRNGGFGRRSAWKGTNADLLYPSSKSWIVRDPH